MDDMIRAASLTKLCCKARYQLRVILPPVVEKTRRRPHGQETYIPRLLSDGGLLLRPTLHPCILSQHGKLTSANSHCQKSRITRRSLSICFRLQCIIPSYIVVPSLVPNRPHIQKRQGLQELSDSTLKLLKHPLILNHERLRKSQMSRGTRYTPWSVACSYIVSF
jgi:hypothetical protein